MKARESATVVIDRTRGKAQSSRTRTRGRRFKI